MAEYRKEVSVAAVIAVVAALAVGIVAIAAFPMGSTTTTTPTMQVNIPAVLLGYLSAQGVSCSPTTGFCTFTIVNNSTDPLDLVSCAVTVASTSIVNSTITVTQYTEVNGTIGGQAASGIPANSQVAATCTLTASQVADETAGATVSGTFVVKLVDSWYNYAAGTEAYSNFEGAWS
jgi:hypothetical protein